MVIQVPREQRYGPMFSASWAAPADLLTPPEPKADMRTHLRKQRQFSLLFLLLNEGVGSDVSVG
jgi:hypothetical protein